MVYYITVGFGDRCKICVRTAIIIIIIIKLIIINVLT